MSLKIGELFKIGDSGTISFSSEIFEDEFSSCCCCSGGRGVSFNVNCVEFCFEKKREDSAGTTGSIIKKHKNLIFVRRGNQKRGRFLQSRQLKRTFKGTTKADHMEGRPPRSLNPDYS